MLDLMGVTSEVKVVVVAAAAVKVVVVVVVVVADVDEVEDCLKVVE